MKIYNYNKETKEFTTSEEATKNPKEKGKYLIPMCATTIEPIAQKEGFAVCFNEKDNTWEYIEDNRGKEVYSTTTKDKSKVDYLGKIKDEYTQLKPSEYDEWIDGAWVEDIASKEKDRVSTIKAKCGEVIYEVYPQYKQTNISILVDGYTQVDLDTMRAFINDKRAICDKAIADGVALESINWG